MWPDQYSRVEQISEVMTLWVLVAFLLISVMEEGVTSPSYSQLWDALMLVPGVFHTS